MKKKVLIISIIALVITFIGSTYAFFMYSKTIKAFTLTSGDINIEFVNGDNNINLTYAYPISDNFAKTNLEKLGYIDFSVNGHITEDKKVINYEIYLEEDSKNTLDSNYIKVYLTDDTNKEIISPKTYNSLDSTSYTNSDNGKVICKVSKKGEFNDKYRIYVWIDSSYTQNVIQERFSFKVNLYAYNDTETAVSVIKSNLVKYVDSSKDTFTGGLVAVNTDGDLYNETDPSQTIREYRYSGPNVNNYVIFNDETWRIVGVFKDEKGEEHVKIVKNEELKGIFPETYIVDGIVYSIKAEDNMYAYWNKKTNENNAKNDWATAGLQYWLNSKGVDGGYLDLLTDSAKQMIYNEKYYLGNLTYASGGNYGIQDTPKKSYLIERMVDGCTNNLGLSENNTQETIENNKTCRVRANNNATWTGEIGLLYPSDYGLSVLSKYWDISFSYNSFNGIVSNSSWINKLSGGSILLISPSSNASNSIACKYNSGNVGAPLINENISTVVLPTLYLKSNVKITSGTGEIDNAYQLSL